MIECWYEVLQLSPPLSPSVLLLTMSLSSVVLSSLVLRRAHLLSLMHEFLKDYFCLFLKLLLTMKQSGVVAHFKILCIRYEDHLTVNLFFVTMTL